MPTEDYCSYELSQLLKEKGFNVETITYYYCTSEYTKSKIYKSPNNTNWNNNEYYYSAPTHQMAMKWLREKYDLHILAYPYKANNENKWCCQVYKTFNLLGCEKYTNETLNSYEEAIEAALKYSLENLI